MNFRKLFTLTIAASLLSVAVAGNKSKDLKNVNFNSIKIENKLDVFITQGNENSVNFDSDDKVIKAVRTEVENGVLRIWLTKKIKKANSRKVNITIKDLKSISASSGAKVCVKEKFDVNDLSLDIRDGSFVMMNLDVNKLHCSVLDGSSAQIKGEVDDFKLQITNKSNVIADKFNCKNCKLNTDGSYAQLNVSDEFDLKASNGSEVYYTGTPSMTVNTSGDTKISKKTILQ